MLITTSAWAQSGVHLKGTVITPAGTPIAGATIRLVKQNLSATSAADGTYEIPSGAAHPPALRLPTGLTGLRLDHGVLRLELASASRVSFSAFDLAGRLCARLSARTLAGGTHAFACTPPGRAAQSGVVRLSVDGEERCYRFVNATLLRIDEGPCPSAAMRTEILDKSQAATIVDSLRATFGSLTPIRLYVYTLVDTIDFILGDTSTYSEARQQIVHRINYYRGTVGLGHLGRRLGIDTCLDAQAKADATSGTAHSAFGRCSEGSQNECPGWRTVEQVIAGCTDAMWNEGPPPVGDPCNYPSACYTAHGHYINMTNGGQYGAPKTVSVGFYMASGTSYWSLQDYWR
jgi:hypothetical protein